MSAGRELARIGRNDDGLISGLWSYFSPPGWSTNWYWPPGCRGKVWNFLHSHGWRIG